MLRAATPAAVQSRGFVPHQTLGRPPRGRKRRRRLPPREETTLVCLIKSLVERKVAVELRNDILLRGRLDDVDDFLNMSLSEVTFQTVEGRNVRFVHLPRNLDPAKAIDSYRHKVIRTKLEAARERAQALGSAKPTPKGQDALAEGVEGSESAILEGTDARGQGTEEEGEGGGRSGAEGEELTDDDEEEEGDEEGTNGDGQVDLEDAAGIAGYGDVTVAALRHLDPRTAASGGGSGTEQGEEVFGFF
ncbi:hypothetical protein Vretimale_2852 [Volvox reticuliferus]|uniref:Sm domain-containing protein n=1 Tax=Volvox reticuliferus TaxID=1737510 RepID=A0A8J4D7J1_9CHLO|nr:hypothetical protein Vretimale_2852 [Volvox reticuliferus]